MHGRPERRCWLDHGKLSTLRYSLLPIYEASLRLHSICILYSFYRWNLKIDVEWDKATQPVTLYSTRPYPGLCSFRVSLPDNHLLWIELQKFTDGDSQVKDAIYRRFRSSSEIMEEWILKVKKYNNTTVRKHMSEGTTPHKKCKDQRQGLA